MSTKKEIPESLESWCVSQSMLLKKHFGMKYNQMLAMFALLMMRPG
jgi:hypothetical protein